MKLNDLMEYASGSMTSVSSIGSIEGVATASSIKLYKKDCNKKDRCIAVIKRIPKNGWKFMPTENWRGMKLPHIGFLYEKPLKIRISCLANMKIAHYL